MFCTLEIKLGKHNFFLNAFNFMILTLKQYLQYSFKKNNVIIILSFFPILLRIFTLAC